MPFTHLHCSSGHFYSGLSHRNKNHKTDSQNCGFPSKFCGDFEASPKKPVDPSIPRPGVPRHPHARRRSKASWRPLPRVVLQHVGFVRQGKWWFNFWKTGTTQLFSWFLGFLWAFWQGKSGDEGWKTWRMESWPWMIGLTDWPTATTKTKITTTRISNNRGV